MVGGVVGLWVVGVCGWGVIEMGEMLWGGEGVFRCSGLKECV